MRSPYTITHIPHTERGLRAAKLLRAVGECHHRKRGRGARGSDRRWHQDLPIERATHFTLYGYPISPPHKRGPEYYQYQRFDFVGWRGDKPVIRYHPRPCTQ